ncbi:MAG TPA: carboxypeptidase-like regulatory domain-containing protein, partial [Puia sp.]|nr:carboxypeptidase-like regulatory domain-containing protein [Puia sp.]
MKTFITILILIISGSLEAQTNIQGIAREANNGPLESVSVSLYKGADTTISKTTITDKEGRFVFSEIPAGIYHVRISAIGFESLTGSDFSIATKGKTVELPVFDLHRKNNEL